MGSAEGFGAGGVVVKQVPREIQSAGSSGAHKEKPQLLKQRNSSTCKRGDKRSSKVQKTRCDSFSLRNGLVGFNSAAGGNNFFGLYGLKPDAFDITKYVNEVSLDDLIRGTLNCPDIAKDKEKTAAKQSDDLLSSVRKACSVLQTRKVSPAQKCAEIDNSFFEKIAAGLANVSSVGGQADGDNVDSRTEDLLTQEEPADKIKTSLVADSRVYEPKDILQRLALPPPKDLDLLLSDASKASSSSKYSTDLRLGKTVSHRTGLPPFSWSHAFSGHNKLGADAGKLSSNRATCSGRWAKVRNSVLLQKGCADLLVDFESLTFDQTLVPKVNPSPENSSHQVERLLTSAAACSTVNVPTDLPPSPTHVAAQTLCDIMNSCSSKEYSSSMKLLHKPMKGCKSKPIEKSDRLFDATKPAIKPYTSVKVAENGVSSKRPKLSSDVPKLCNGHTDSQRKGTSHWSVPQSFRSPPSKLFRDSNPFSIDFVKTSYMMKPPRAVDRPSSSQQKLKKAVPVKWSRPES